jgi:hypothetical protein
MPALSSKEGMLCKKALGKSNTKILEAESRKKQETGNKGWTCSPAITKHAQQCS